MNDDHEDDGDTSETQSLQMGVNFPDCIAGALEQDSDPTMHGWGFRSHHMREFLSLHLEFSGNGPLDLSQGILKSVKACKRFFCSNDN